MGRHVACSVRAVAAPVRGIYIVLSVFYLGQNTIIFWSSSIVYKLNLLSYKVFYPTSLLVKRLLDAILEVSDFKISCRVIVNLH